MKTLLPALILSLSFNAAIAQQNISGTVTYFYKDNAYWVDAPATVYLFDSSTTDEMTLHLLDTKIDAETGQQALYDRMHRQRLPINPAMMDLSDGGHMQWVKDSLQKRANQLSQLKDSLQLRAQMGSWDSLENLLYGPASPLFSGRGVSIRTGKAGKYLLQIEQPGTFYILIRPVDERAVTAGNQIAHKCCLKKIRVDKGDKQDVSVILKL